jgi:hypothetical protein
MGQIMKQVGEGTTRYYWYPGDKVEWYKSGLAVGLGMVVFGITMALTHRGVASVTLGATVTAVLAGLNFGRRDARALTALEGLAGKAAKRAVVVHGSRAAWRAIVEGVGGAMIAVFIVNLPAHGFLADWLFPIVPAAAGALAHQAGMHAERLTRQEAMSQTHPGVRRTASASG